MGDKRQNKSHRRRSDKDQNSNCGYARLGRQVGTLHVARTAYIRRTSAAKPQQEQTGTAKWRKYLLGGDWPLVRLPELVNNTGVAPEILLATDENDGETGAEVHNLGNPLYERNQPNLLGKTRQGEVRRGGRTFSCTLSSESGESTAKQMRMTWESG